MVHFTPQEQRIVNALGDGKPHTDKDLMQYLDDDLSSVNALFMCISRIRAKLRPYNQFIHRIEATSAYIHVCPKTAERVNK